VSGVGSANGDFLDVIELHLLQKAAPTILAAVLPGTLTAFLLRPPLNGTIVGRTAVETKDEETSRAWTEAEYVAYLARERHLFARGSRRVA